MCSTKTRVSHTYSTISSSLFDIDQKQALKVDSEVFLEEQGCTQDLVVKRLHQVSPDDDDTSSSCTVGTSHQEPQNCHLTVTHDYHDHANEEENPFDHHHRVKGGVIKPFPMKVHQMLVATKANHMEDIVSWQPHGRCFLVHKPKKFDALLPQYFKLSKLASFQRQLNLYGFQRITKGRDRGGYNHEFFLRDREFLVQSIDRIRIKGTGVRARSSPEQEPDFWAMPWVGPIPIPTRSVVEKVEPRQVTPPPPLNNDDDGIVDVFDRTIHFLNPFHPPVGNWNVEKIERLMEFEAKDFFEGSEFQPLQGRPGR